jgi:hypothetical protein
MTSAISAPIHLQVALMVDLGKDKQGNDGQNVNYRQFVRLNIQPA